MDENKSIKTNVSFESAGLKLAGHLYTPDPDTSPSLPAIVVGPPGSSVKEQAAGMYARRLRIRRAQAASMFSRGWEYYLHRPRTAPTFSQVLYLE